MSVGLDVDAVTVRAGPAVLLDAVTCRADAGRLTGLIGPNGAGKSTLMRAALGLLPLQSGRITFAGADLPRMNRRVRAQLTAFVEQSGAAEVQLTAREVVALGRIPFQSIWQASPSPADDLAVGAALAAVGMASFAERHYHTLSGGEQQRLQVARALAQQPQLLILDEPTNHLDVQAQLSILTLLRQRARAGATVLLALHDLNLAAAFCDELVVLQHGRVVAQGAPEAVLTPSLLHDVYGVQASLLRHPGTGRPMIAYDMPSE
ncbi:ABC transporter ATP-binding protein [Devosia beringensis]|uniref:ABC transporter ATP-binding protein n=1 Tax=Devosia beringensis TaxID=2657486 RepID=UPI00186BAE8D|nr:ATP-binding cassette domain-containing protein [Devosia beringensis]